MPLIKWREQYSVQIPQIDEHHQHLFYLLNKTYDDFIERSHDQNQQGLLDELIDYATYHFSTEEEWMQKTMFPGLQKHQEEHNEFSQNIRGIALDLQDNEKIFSLEILSFLYQWLSSHILKSDAEFGLFLASENKSLMVNDSKTA